MPNLDDPVTVAGPTSTAAGRRCATRRILDTVDTGRRAQIVARLHADGRQTGWSDHALSAALRELGLTVGYNALNLHRRRLCVCTDYQHDDEYEAQ